MVEPLTLAQVAQALQSLEPRLLGDASIRVSDVCQDSRSVMPGALFVARAGAAADGERYIAAALQRGAVAVLREPGPVPLGVPELQVAGVRRALGFAAEAVHHTPSQRLKLIGITGTNGKTTTASLLQQCLQRLGHTVATLGTLGVWLNGQQRDTGLTTAEADVVSRVLREAVDAGASHAVMEVSSHALDQGRVDALSFAVAAFSNLTQDHLDYHGSMDSYGQAKARLFAELNPAERVVNAADAFGRELLGRFGGISVGRAAELDIALHSAEISATHSVLHVATPQGELRLRTQLVGEHNVDNWLLTLGVLHALGANLAQVAAFASDVSAAPGRMERVAASGADISVLVDYAHTPDALERALQAARGVVQSSQGKLWCVFGCGGDRDRTKRPEMGAISVRLADHCIVTSDNPRSEEPAQIVRDIEAGIQREAGRAASNYSVQLDRHSAIGEAILQASVGDVVLVAGKGHEDYQLIGAQRLDFDDRQVAKYWLTQRAQGRP